MLKMEEYYGLFKFNLILKEIAKQRKLQNDFRLFDWKQLTESSPIYQQRQIWKHVLVKLTNIDKDEVVIGPVDRAGQKQQNSISYRFEGVIWRFLNLLSALYPRTILITGEERLIKNSPEYIHLVQTLRELSILPVKQLKNMIVSENDNKLPCITSKLWEHQESTTKKIAEGFTKHNKKGFGDASCVGAGKTLTALTVMVKLMEAKLENNENQEFQHAGFLVLIPYKTLFETWTEEIKKHTKYFHVIQQNANGSLTDIIKKNSIIISTLARIREHPLQKSWTLVIIDECLAVQRREALQTEEAWRQVISSQYGVLMMSATFFRSRFDQLFYMLKMLRTQLQENKEFLDCILSESMVCYISENTRKWNIQVEKVQLSENLRKKYDNILNNANLDSEKLYQQLQGFIHNEYFIIPDWQKAIKNLEEKIGDGCRILIYAKSKQEADDISERIDNVSRFPNISQHHKHVVASYHEATFGVNSLVIYNAILTRPPEPDKLPQMKGRLDRQGQKQNNLHLHYIVLENTIEEALLFRLELCAQFFNHYVMPLATFYDYAVGRKQKEEK